MMRDVRSNHLITDEELLEQFQLKNIFSKRMGTLSGGTRQKVSAALAYLFAPDVLVLDEPTAGLDPYSSEIFKQKIISEKRKGKLTLITSHNMGDVEELADRIVFMLDGEVKFFKTVEEIKIESGENKLNKALAGMMKKAEVTNHKSQVTSKKKSDV
jgi:Cu-processing system ATP-binding protein